MHGRQAALEVSFDWNSFPAGCTEDFHRLPDPPQFGNGHNGLQVPDVCFKKKGPHYVYVIGDWGGLMGPKGPVPADERGEGSSWFVKGVDDCAQQRVAGQMMHRADAMGRAPDYILNVGDNFYWQGLDLQCGAAPAWQILETGQFKWNFEAIYYGPGLEGKAWLSVLGNHDYGGYNFNRGWDQQVAYTWKEGGRWMLPAQYWRTKVHYPGFSVDYYFVDSNQVEGKEPHADKDHNICSMYHVDNEASGGCGEQGPKDVWDCPGWFARLWEEQVPWLEKALEASTADWQIVVTHFPPNWKIDYWVPTARKYGIDLFVTGHMHEQEFHYMEPDNFLRPTAWIVSGGGGGITSESRPDPNGYDNQYGFFELTMTKDTIEIQGISHGGMMRMLAFLKPRGRGETAAPHAGQHKQSAPSQGASGAHGAHEVRGSQSAASDSDTMNFKK